MDRYLAAQLRHTLGVDDPDGLEHALDELKQLSTKASLSDEASQVLSGLGGLLHKVSATYEQLNRDLELRTRSLQISSDELAAVNRRLEDDAIIQRNVIEQLRQSANTIRQSTGLPEIGSDVSGLSELATTLAVMMREREVVQHELSMQQFAMDQHAIISITDLNGVIIYANERFSRITGYSSEELIGKNHRIINSGLHPKSFFRGMWQTILSGEVWRGEIRNINKNRQMYWVSATIVPLAGEDGRPERFIAIRTDITHRKLAEAALEESRGFLQCITDTLDDGLFRLDDEMFCVFMNPAAEKLLGLSLIEVLDRPFFDVVALHDRAYQDVDVHALLAETGHRGIRSEDFSLRIGDGRIFPVSLTLAPLDRSDSESGWIGSFRDITERKDMLDALQVSERRLSVAFDAAQTFLWEWNLDSGDGFVSDNFYQLLGYQRGDIVFQWNTVAGLLHPEDADAEFAERHRHLRGESEHYTAIHRLHTGSGEWRWFCSTGKVTTYDAAGHPLRFTGIAYDIDDRKRAEEELACAKEEADRANQMKSQFLANMSHELRTPLNAVIGLGHLVRQTPLQPQQLDYLLKMESASQHLLGLINDILDYSKIEAGKLAIEKIPLGPAETVRDIINLLQPKAQQKQLMLLFEVAEGLPSVVLGDRKRLGQVLLNLTDNALKFTEHGEVHVSLDGHWIDDSHFNLQFHIRDQGIGLTDEQRSRLFKPFEQADGSTARNYGGTGLGLAICRELVELMGGSIDVDSTPGVGSDFFFNIPCAIGEQLSDSEISTVSSLSSNDVMPVRPRRALIVEDDALNQELAKAMLKGLGIDAEVAGTGAEAISLLSGQRFDLMLQDMELPDMSGLDIVRKVRDELGGQDIRIITLTGHTGEEERERCLAAGADEFVSKPYDFSVLTQRIQQLLGLVDVPPTEHSVRLRRDTAMEILWRLEPPLLAFDPAALDVGEEFERLCRGSTLAIDAARLHRALENFDFLVAKRHFDLIQQHVTSMTGEFIHE